MKHQLKLCVADNRSFAPGWHLLRLESPEALPEMDPGQFVEVRVEAPGVLLNRPISIFDRTDRTLDLLVSPVGNATEALCALAEGSDLTVIAPLGHGFTTTFEPGTRVLLIGGGVGIAPLYYQLRMLRDAGVDVEVVFGSRTAPDAALCALFERLAPLHICTDDGTAGLHGLVTDHPELERLRLHSGMRPEADDEGRRRRRRRQGHTLRGVARKYDGMRLRRVPVLHRDYRQRQHRCL